MSTPPSFAQLGVPKSIVAALSERGIDGPFEIQAATIADALAGRDVLGRAPTGSGKTIAFGIPVVANAVPARPKKPTALILAPTRELAEQIHTELKSFAGKVRIGVVYGGVGYGPQVNSLRAGVEILVACPGRLQDLIDRRDVSLERVEHVVLDEADRMADMGFMPAVRKLLDQTTPDRQTVLFSATLDGDVRRLTQQYQSNPVRHEVGEKTPDITAASHMFWKVAQKADRVSVTADAVNAVWPAIVFCRTRHGSDRLAKQLGRFGVQSAAIHGGRSQGQRTRALASFARGEVQALIATDVAARGIHVDGVAAVVHYDSPEDHKAYIHRSGRTARAGEGGVVVSLLLPEQVRDAKQMQRRVGLDEPVTEPDTPAMQELSTAPSKPKPAAQPTQQRERTTRAKTKKHGGPNRPRRGGAQGKKGRKQTSAGSASSPQRGERTAAGSNGRSSQPGTKKQTSSKGASAAARRRRRAHLQWDSNKS
ncbi:MAG: DEAD/DEAH box helicase [Acidimicrobiales bacterium]|nr:DEAD/DEAH box helicase [Acidimicrobiales bacterium]